MYSKEELRNALEKTGYYADNKTLNALWVSLLTDRPLLLEGDPGTGKTALAKALAEGLDFNYQRLQMYEGLTDDKILYDINYTKELLVSNMIREKAVKKYERNSINTAIQKLAADVDFFDDSFIIKRPILNAITSEKPTVLCIDELDKSSEEVEYMLYEFLENYSITIPENGKTYTAKTHPVVIITSNGYRELSGALRRRCNYLYIENKSTAELARILMLRASVSEPLAQAIAECFAKLREKPESIRKQPSVGEAIDYAVYLKHAGDNLTKEYVLNGLSILCKNHHDEPAIRNTLQKFDLSNGWA